MTDRRCRCGHPASVHVHYRVGTDCGECRCRKYERSPPPRGPMAIVVLAVANSINNWMRKRARRQTAP